MRTLAILACCAACGRVGFATVGADGAARDATNGDSTSPAPDAPTSFATPAFLQSQQGAATGTSQTTTIAATGAGHLIVVGANSYGPLATVANIVDDVGNLYASSHATATGSDGDNEIWYARDSRAGATLLTISWSASSNLEAWVVEVSGVDTTNPIDAIAAVPVGATTTTLQAPEVEPSTPHAFVFSVVQGFDLTGITTGNPFTALPGVEGDDAAYASTAQLGDYGAEWDASAPGQLTASTAAFKAAPL